MRIAAQCVLLLIRGGKIRQIKDIGDEVEYAVRGGNFIASYDLRA